MPFQRAVPLTFVLLYLGCALTMAAPHLWADGASERLGDFGTALIGNAMSLAVIFAMALLLALVLAAIFTIVLRRDFWWAGALAVFLVLVSPQLLALLPTNSVLASFYSNGCQAVIAGELTECGAAQQLRGLIDNVVFAAIGAALHALIAAQPWWRKPIAPSPTESDA